MQITEQLIRQIVQEVVERIEALQCSNHAENRTSAPSVRFQSKVLTGSDVEYYVREGFEILHLSKKTVITPLAWERSRDLDLQLVLD